MLNIGWQLGGDFNGLVIGITCNKIGQKGIGYAASCFGAEYRCVYVGVQSNIVLV